MYIIRYGDRLNFQKTLTEAYNVMKKIVTLHEHSNKTNNETETDITVVAGIPDGYADLCHRLASKNRHYLAGTPLPRTQWRSIGQPTLELVHQLELHRGNRPRLWHSLPDGTRPCRRRVQCKIWQERNLRRPHRASSHRHRRSRDLCDKRQNLDSTADDGNHARHRNALRRLVSLRAHLPERLDHARPPQPPPLPTHLDAHPLGKPIIGPTSK